MGDLIKRLRDRIRPEHGGSAFVGGKDWWYLSADDSLMHKECVDTIAKLRLEIENLKSLGKNNG